MKSTSLLRYFALSSVVLLAASCAQTYQSVVFAMDTSISCTAKVNKESEIQEVLKTFEDVESYADATYHHYSVTGVYDINNASKPIEISKELYDLLAFSLDMKEKSNGYFNPLCLGLTSLWKTSLHPTEAGKSASLPSYSDIQTELDKINNTTLKLDEVDGTYYAYLQVKDPSAGRASLDLGGIAKGYAARLAKEKITSCNWEFYALNAGNSTMILGKAENNDGYFNLSWKEDLPNKTVRIQDTCLSTSSVTVQGVEIDGKMYSHLVNPFTGEASPSITGVTLFGDDPAEMDALSTALMWMDEKEQEALEAEFNIKAIYYKDGQVVRDSSNLIK